MSALDVEKIKAASGNLRGTLLESLQDPLTGAISEADTQLSKFHGIYQQDDRDVRSERARRKLEPAYSFMIRARIPGGLLTTSQWLAMDRIAGDYANDSIRLTTRQAVQFHGVIKRNLKQTIADINQAALDTLAACGDVNRNVMSPPLPALSRVHRAVQKHAEELSTHLSPQTGAYHEIWLLTGRSSIRPKTKSNRSTARPICHASSKRHSRYRRRTMSTSGHRTLVSSRSSKTVRLRASMSLLVVAWG